MLLDNFDEALSSLPTSTAQHQRKASIASTISNNSVFSTASSDLLEAEAPINSQHRRALSSRYPASATARPSGMRRGSSESVRTTPAAPPVTRLERYAAHIPVRDQEPDIGYGPMAQLTPSRHSLTSVDSFATAATGGSESQLDAAAKQVEQMINEAKYRHRQHRSKFKEAIDYLDQIYEDIRKECDQFPKEISNSIQRTEQNAEVFNQDPHPPPIPPAPASYVPSDQMSQLSEYEERVLVPPETMAQNRLCGDRLDFM
uniref:Uncharacterized protein n=1 Tax=Plectus sambesii TaxID=2011161 RepID=A0A914UPB3_9BILA